MPSYPPLLPPSSLGDALRTIADLSSDQIATLEKAVSGPRSFSLSKDELDALRRHIPEQSGNLTFLLAALSYLYSQVARVVDLGMPFSEAISALVDELEEDAEWQDRKEEVARRLGSILHTSEAHQRFRKIQRLQAGFIPNAIGFGTFVDLRPDFGDGEELQISGYLPVIQLRISTDSPSPDGKRLVFQLTEDGLVELKKVLERAEAKLAVLREQSSLVQIVKI